MKALCISENETCLPVGLWILDEIRILLKYLSWIYFHSQVLTLNLRFMNLNKVIRKQKKKNNRKRKNHTGLVFTEFLFWELLIFCELSLKLFQLYNIHTFAAVLGHDKSRNCTSSNQNLRAFLMCSRNCLILWCLCFHVLLYQYGDPNTQHTQLGCSSPCTIMQSCVGHGWCLTNVNLLFP